MNNVKLIKFKDYVHEYFEHKVDMCRRYGISDQLGYKWLRREDLYIAENGDMYKKLKSGEGLPKLTEKRYPDDDVLDENNMMGGFEDEAKVRKLEWYDKKVAEERVQFQKLIGIE